MPAHAADSVERHRHGRTGALGMWPVGSREPCRPRTEAEGKLVTESDLSLRAPAQVVAYAWTSCQPAGWFRRARMAVLGLATEMLRPLGFASGIGSNPTQRGRLASRSRTALR